MVKYKTADLIHIHNTLAKRKGYSQIVPSSQITLNQIADRLEWINRQPIKVRGQQTLSVRVRRSFCIWLVEWWKGHHR